MRYLLEIFLTLVTAYQILTPSACIRYRNTPTNKTCKGAQGYVNWAIVEDLRGLSELSNPILAIGHPNTTKIHLWPKFVSENLPVTTPP